MTTLRIDPRIRLLDWLLNQRRPVTELTLDEIEQRNKAPIQPGLAWLFLGASPQLPKVENRAIAGRHGGIPVRLYYPQVSDQRQPLIIFFHGGGWVTNSLETHDVICRRLAQDCQAIVLSVSYRLAPWYKFPVPLDDCYDATLWACEQAIAIGADPKQLILMGDSAGGNLATAVCLLSRDRGGPSIWRQVLIYPAVDGTLSFPSHATLTEVPLLTAKDIHFFRAQYARSEADYQNPYFSPYWSEDLTGVPPALILTAEYDPLRDEAAAYAERLQAAQVPVQYTDYPGMVHGFLSFPRFCVAAKQAFAEIATYVEAAIRA